MHEVKKKGVRDDITVWRGDPESGIEYRRGTAVSEPYPRHWHDEYQLCLVTEGGGALNYRGSRYETPASSLFIVHPGEIHSNHTATGCSFRSIYIKPDLIQQIAYEIGLAGPEPPFFADTIVFDAATIANFVSLHRASEGATPELEVEYLLRRFLLRLMELSAKRISRQQGVGHEPAVVARIREYITENHDRNISLSELEELTGFSTFHLNRVFSRAVGVPPHEFQTQVRIAAARELIRHGSTLANTAAAVGFADQSHLHRHFLRLMKVTPGDYSKASKNVQEIRSETS